MICNKQGTARSIALAGLSGALLLAACGASDAANVADDDDVDQAAVTESGFNEWGWPVEADSEVSEESIDWLEDQGWWPLTFTYQPVYGQVPIMEDLQLLERRGLEVEYQAFDAGSEAIEAFLAGRAQLNVSGNLPFVSMIAQDGPVESFAVAYPNGRSAVVVPEESDAESLDDLFAGGEPTIATVAGSSAEFYLGEALRINGYDLAADADLLNLAPAELATLPSGVDAVVLWDPFLAVIEDRGTGRLIDLTYDTYMYHGFVWSHSELQANAPDVVQAFSDAWIEASLFARYDPEESTDIVHGKPGMSNWDRDIVRDAVIEPAITYKPTHPLPNIEAVTAHVLQAAEFLIDSGRLDEALAADEVGRYVTTGNMESTFDKLGWTTPERPVWIPEDWSGDYYSFPLMEYHTPDDPQQPFPEDGDLVTEWYFDGEHYTP